MITYAKPGPTLRAARHGVVGACTLLLLAGCAESCPPPQVVVVNNSAPADAGQSVLLTVMIGVAFVAAALAVVFAWIAARQQSRRRDAERAQRWAEDDLLVVTDRARARDGYDLPMEHRVPSGPTRETYRARAEDLRRSAIERGRS